MSNDRFGGGFLAGSIFGSITGGLLGAWVATKLSNRLAAEETVEDENTEQGSPRLRSPSFLNSGGLEMEDARQSLEEKISQLNSAIDQAREQLSEVNGNASE